MLSRRHAPAPSASACAISLASCLLSKWRSRIESAPRSEAHLEWARAKRLGKQRDVPCLAVNPNKFDLVWVNPATSLLACAARRDVVAAVSAAAPASAGPVAVADSASTLAARAAAGAGAAAVGCGHALCAARLGSTRQQGSRAPARRRGRRAKRSTQFYCSCPRELDALRDASWGRQPAVRPARRIVGAPASRAPTSALRQRADNS